MAIMSQLQRPGCAMHGRRHLPDTVEQGEKPGTSRNGMQQLGTSCKKWKSWNNVKQLGKAGTAWNKLKHNGTGWNKLDEADTAWYKLKTEKQIETTWVKLKKDWTKPRQFATGCNKVEQFGNSWNNLKQGGVNRNKLEQRQTAWNKLEQSIKGWN